MLEQLLGAPSPASVPTRQGEISRPPGLPADGTVMVVRLYQLHHQQVGAPEFATKLKVLEQLIPAGGILKEDPPSNSVSVLTSPRIQEAVYAYLSAIDTAPAPSSLEIPAEVQKALKQMAATSEETARQIEKIGALNMSEVNKQLSQIADQNKWQRYWYVGIGLCIAVIFILIFWITRSKGNQSTQLALVPTTRAIEQIANNQQAEREEVVALLRNVALKMDMDRQSQADLAQKLLDGQLLMAENKIQLGELVQERKQVMRDAENLLTKAISEFGEKSEILQTEQGRVQALADQLRETINELDLTRDRLGQKEVDLSKAQYALEHEKAKIAAISILMEEGKLGPGAMPSFAPLLPPTGASDTPFEPTPVPVVETALTEDAVSPQVEKAEPTASPESPTTPVEGSVPKPFFKFLPPDE